MAESQIFAINADSGWIGEFDKEQLEVIGNIFDNSELLEVE